MPGILTRLEAPRPWTHLLRRAPVDERHEVAARDGWRLTLRRVRPHAGSAPRPRPLMLLHGLSANHQSWHMPERSMAEWLAARGHDVWMPELRGHGDSEARRWDWGLDEYLLADLPALIEAILERTGAPALDWVGHSMGGILLMSYLGFEPGAPVGRGVAIASALDYTQGETGFARLFALRPALERVPAVPYGALSHLLAPAAGRGGRLRYNLEAFHVWPANIEPWMIRRIYARCFHAIPTSLFASLAQTFDPEGFALADGRRVLEHAPACEAPLLLVGASRDAQVAPEAIAHTAQHIGDNARVAMFGAPHGHRTDYGHFDLVLGRHAPAEVWPQVAAFLEG